MKTTFFFHLNKSIIINGLALPKVPSILFAFTIFTAIRREKFSSLSPFWIFPLRVLSLLVKAFFYFDATENNFQYFLEWCVVLLCNKFFKRWGFTTFNCFFFDRLFLSGLLHLEGLEISTVQEKWIKNIFQRVVLCSLSSSRS